MVGLATFLAFASLAAASASQARKVQRHVGFMHAIEFKYQLRVCNAYPDKSAIEVVQGKESLTDGSPLAYKSCRDFSPQLKAGDRLDFKIGDTSAGTFLISKLPDINAVLLLVIHRRDAGNMAAAFQSHVFSSMDNAQLAVIDTYGGEGDGQVQISTMKAPDPAAGNGAPARINETLPFSSVVEINRGKYEVELAGKDGEAKAKAQLIALDKQSYVLLRTGLGSAFPQELVVFPQSSVSDLKGGAADLCPARSGLLLALATMLMLLQQ